jgi:hypothetical protein
MRQGDTTNKAPVIKVKNEVKKDTTYMIIHEVSQELVTISEDSYAIQLGAFRNKANAEVLSKKLSKLLDKKVDIIIEDDFYKVRISDIKERKKVDENLSVLKQNGVTEVWVINLKAKHQQLVLTEKQDTITKITENITETPFVAINPEILIQLGAFHQKGNAIALGENVSGILSRKLIIVFEGGYYKVRLAGIPILDQTVLEEMKKLEGSIGKLGIKNLWLVPFKPQPEEPVILIRETTIKPVEWKKQVTVCLKPETKHALVKEKIVAQASAAEPTISLQVGVFHKYSLALRAQKRITSKLKLPVEIIKQYEYYHVLVTGFYKREETYKYYPELAGLGYPGITLIEKK